VLAHARALLTSTDEGATGYVDADLRDTRAILDAAAQTLDLVPPGVAYVHTWRPDPGDDVPGDATSAHGGVARKPWPGPSAAGSGVAPSIRRAAESRRDDGRINHHRASILFTAAVPAIA
jgi:hypothetical protein